MDAGDIQAVGERQAGAGDLIRPCLAALIESQRLPVLMFGPDGELLARNAAADRFVLIVDGEHRLLARDGTDIWTIIEARSDEAAPFFDVSLRIRLAAGDSSAVSILVIPVRGPRGALGGALGVVLSEPAERLRAPGPGAETALQDTFETIVTRLGESTGAAGTVILELDQDFEGDARVVVSWSPGSTRMPQRTISMGNTPFDEFAGRRIVCVPSGLAKAYPGVPMFARGEYESYVGLALTSPAGDRIGVLAGVWSEPLADVAGTCAVFSILGDEAAHALWELRSDRELRDSQQRYGAVFEGGAVPILLIEPTTTQIVDANAAASAFYGYSREDFLTMSVLQLDSAGGDAARAELDRVVDGARGRLAGQHLLADGRVRDVELNMGPVVVGGRRLVYSMISDITERRSVESERERHERDLERAVGQRTEDLLRANAELQQASMARDMMFASIAQEIHGPLEGIAEAVESFLSGAAGEPNDSQRALIEAVRAAERRLAAFAGTLLETRRIEQGVAACDPEEFDLADLAESVVVGLSTFAQSKGLSLRLLANERPLEVVTDRYRVQQILLSLLSNAVRYTERGGVTVSVSRQPDGMMAVAVSDTGPGISAERLETLFEGPEVRDWAAGIGLPASKRIAGQLGGTIKVVTAASRGSVFTLIVPARCEGTSAGTDR